MNTPDTTPFDQYYDVIMIGKTGGTLSVIDEDGTMLSPSYHSIQWDGNRFQGVVGASSEQFSVDTDDINPENLLSRRFNREITLEEIEAAAEDERIAVLAQYLQKIDQKP